MSVLTKILKPEMLIGVYRRVRSRRIKAFALAGMRSLGLRHLVVRMDTVNLCNLRCRMCYYSSEVQRKRITMDLPTFQSVARQIFPKTRFLYLSCSTEPLMNKDFAAMLRETGAHGVPFTSFCTNGQLVSEEVIQAAIDARISEIIFSIDGATEGTYEYIRRGANWRRLLDRLALFQSLKQRASVNHPVGRINFTCMSRNIGELPAMVHFAADHGIPNLHVRHLLAFSDEQNSWQAEVGYRRVFNSVASEAAREASRRKVALFLPDPIEEGKCGKPAGDGRRRGESNPYCLLPWFHIIISWDGDCRVCSIHRSLGNLRAQSFAEIYNGPRLCEIRRKMLSRAPDACSWNCREEAYDVPPPVEESSGLVGISPQAELSDDISIGL